MFVSRQLVCRWYNTVTRSLTSESDAAKTTVQAFITCRLDYCNAILYGITDDLVRRLQYVQNAAARLLSGARRSDHITPVATAPLAACEVTYPVQVGSARIQVAAWFNASLLVRRLLTCLRCRPPSAPFIWCLHVCGPSHSDGFQWQSFPSSWT